MSESQFNHDDVIQLIWDIEDSFNINSLEVNGVNVWPILRQSIYAENLIKSRCTQKKELFKKVIAFLRISGEWLLDRANKQQVNCSDVYILTHTTSRTAQVAGKWQDFIFTPLIYFTGKVASEIAIHIDEFAPGGEYRYPRNEPSAYISFSLAISYFFGNLFPARFPIEHSLQIERISKFIQARGGNVSSLRTEVMSQRLAQFFRCVRFFERRLVNVRPKLIFVVTYYSLPGMALMHAGSKMGIKTVDVQHGVQGAAHAAYGKWKSFPAKGYSCLPDYFWVWSDIEKKQMQNLDPAHQVLVGGNLQMAYWLNKTHPGQMALGQRIDDAGRTKVILVTLQPGGEYLIGQILQTIDSGLLNDCFWLFRLHPAMVMQYGEVLANQLENYLYCCESTLASSLPLPVVLRLARAHITLFSSVTIEAAQRGIPTLLCHDPGGAYAHLESFGMVRVKPAEEDIASAMMGAFLQWNDWLPALTCDTHDTARILEVLKGLLGKTSNSRFENSKTPNNSANSDGPKRQ